MQQSPSPASCTQQLVSCVPRSETILTFLLPPLLAANFLLRWDASLSSSSALSRGSQQRLGVRAAEVWEVWQRRKRGRGGNLLSVDVLLGFCSPWRTAKCLCKCCPLSLYSDPKISMSSLLVSPPPVRSAFFIGTGQLGLVGKGAVSPPFCLKITQV